MPFFLNISTSPSRNRLCRSLIRLLLVSTVYIRSSKQREFFAAFIPKSPGILGPHGAAGVAGPRCPLWTANPAAKPTIRTPTRIPERPKPVSTNCFFIALLLNASAHRAGYGFYPHRKLLEIRLSVGIINGVGFGWGSPVLMIAADTCQPAFQTRCRKYPAAICGVFRTVATSHNGD